MDVENFDEFNDNDEMSKKIFDKYLCLNNIRFLLNNTNIKISQIERTAGCQIGYMSRIEKKDSNQDPSLAFVYAASKLLDISVNLLLTVDLTSMTTTEIYILKMINKLIDDTLLDKLDWIEHSSTEYSNIESDINGNICHPLFDYVMDEDGNNDYSNIVFKSKKFGYDSKIFGSCYSLSLKNRSCLYLMSASKSKIYSSEEVSSSQEIWLFVPYSGKQYIAGSNDDNPIGTYVIKLFDVLKKYFSHPIIKKDFKSVLDSFMNDDYDDSDDLPF